MLVDLADQLRNLIPFILTSSIVQGNDVALPLFRFSDL